MPGQTVPRPDLAQLKLQAKELLRAHAGGKLAAAARVAARHPKMRGKPPEAVLATPLKLADAQLVVAREHGFESWTALEHRLELGEQLARLTPHPRFDEALAAVRAGDVGRLRDLISREPDVVTARTNLDLRHGYFGGATLLHHVAGNPSWDRPLPGNIVEVARLLLESGADVNASTIGRSGGTTMGLVITSKQASDAGVSGPLIDLLLEHGAALDLASPAGVVPDWGRQELLALPLANHAPRAAEKLIELGAKAGVCAAAALGRMDLLREQFDGRGRLRSRPRRRGKLLSERDAVGLAMLFAYVNGHGEAVDFLLEKDGNWDMTGVNNGTVLHRAAFAGDLGMVKRLVAKGADMSNRDNPFNSTPLSWALHGKQQEVAAWMRANCVIDLHEAVCCDLPEHVEARLREDPASVNRRLDQWDVPQSTPLYWAAWPRHQDLDGEHSYDLSARERLVKLLLEKGADPNIVAGDGHTPLDVALAAGAQGAAKLIERHGGKRGDDL